MIQAAILLSSYLTGVWVFLLMVCLLPGQSLALTSPQAYARVVAQAEWIAYQAATKPQVVQAVAQAASAASPASFAIRAVAGPIGWAALGVTAGLVLYQTFYPQATLEAVKQAAQPPAGPMTRDGQSFPAGAFIAADNCGAACGVGQTQVVYAPAWHWQELNSCPGSAILPGPAGWSNGSTWGGAPGTGTDGSSCYALFTHTVNATDDPFALVPTGGPATPQQIADYVAALPADSPLSIEHNSQPLGQGKPADQAAQTQVVPVSPTDLPTTVKPKSQVSHSDIIVADNVPPPGGTTTTTQTTQQSTTTTATVTNPDGTTTESKTTTAGVSCTASGGHDERTLGTILAEHQAAWSNSGLIGAVNLLKTLAWPTTLPVVELPSTFFGTQQVDFNQWAWAFTALRTLVIAVASLAAYRIIFVGGR